MAEEKALVVQAPVSGIASSPHTGFGDVRNLDLFELPGIVKLNNVLKKASASNVTNLVKWIVRDPITNTGQNFYAVDFVGEVYVSTNKGVSFDSLAAQPGTAGGEGQGMAIWKDYLFVARETALDSYGPLSSSPNWKDDFQTNLTSDLEWHPMLVSKLDGKLYIGSGRYMATLAEKAEQNFADDTAGTYTWSGGDSDDNALDLPEDYRIKCLAELGNNLMMGTWVGSTNADAITENKIADIFPWDGSSTTYGKPIQLKENGINAMINIGGNLYILAGIDGKIFKSNGVQAWQIGQVPNSIADTAGGKHLEPYPGAIINYKSKLFFSMSSSGGTVSDEVEDGVGIYSLTETSQGNILTLEHGTSEEVYGSTNPTIISALLGVGRDQLVAGWRNNATYGIDLTTVTSFAYTTDYSGYFESRLRDVGTTQNLRTFTAMEFYLAKELAASEGIRVKFRINLTDTFTTLGTYTTAEIGTGKTSFRTEEISIPACEQIQIRVELLGTATTSPEFKSIMFF